MLKRLSFSVPALLLAGLFTVFSPSDALAREKVDQVSLSFSLNDDDWSQLDVDANSEGYLIDKVTLYPSGSEASPYPYAIVVLNAAEDYYFSSIKSKYFTLQGEGASFVEAARTNSNATMTVSVRLKDLGEGELDEPEGLTWHENGVASWQPVNGAGSYSVRIRYNGENMSVASSPKTEQPVFNLSTKITKPGDYVFQVRANGLYKKTKGSEWVTSPVMTVDEAKLAYIRQNASPDLGIRGQWFEDESGRWYQFITGEIPMLGWREIDGDWYYFDASGYILTDQWIEQRYYVGSNGKMLKDTLTPDGHYVDENGAWAPK